MPIDISPTAISPRLLRLLQFRLLPFRLERDSATSGLTYSVERFKGHRISAHNTLVKGERSELAELAANIL